MTRLAEELWLAIQRAEEAERALARCVAEKQALERRAKEDSMKIMKTNGTTTDLNTLRDEHPDLVVYDASGFELDPDDMDCWSAPIHGRIALIWACEEDSVDDDGSNAIAEVLS